MEYFLMWLFIGSAFTLWMLHVNHEDYSQLIHENKLHISQIVLGSTLTVLLWPIPMFRETKRYIKKVLSAR